VINCLIIEGNKNTIKLIKTVGVDFPEISFIEVYENQEEALNLILKNTPELIFLNFDSIKINFAEFLLKIHQCITTIPYFIALSSVQGKAFEAYNYAFSDFLVKPLTKFSIRKSLFVYKKKHPIKQIKTICLKSYKDYQYLNIDDILYLKADNNTTDFHMEDGSIIGAYKTLKVFENLLPQTFLRIHKSYIINRNSISRIHYGKSMCIIKNEHKIPFTKTFIANIDLINKSLSKNTMITLN
jgi:DNA-binding LytR/AlgR family response regulator|tara:strand:- start:43653 stop:44375 length:723 start_codon:yes stop_codon:yes gene_type:complete